MQHKAYASGGWKRLTVVQQMANIGSEVERTMKWRSLGKARISENAFVRCLELVDLTLCSTSSFAELKEFGRMRELLVDYFFGDNEYGSSDEIWKKYFFEFTLCCNKLR